ncbi:MAG: dTMP kinase, partial [Nitrospirae bacterium CG_4_10_14_3_um_filter_44_29]
AARIQHIKEKIIPALSKGKIVITDRFSDSTAAYQGYGRDISLKLIDSLDRIATGRMRPDLTI